MPQPLPVYIVHSPALRERRAALDRALASLGWTATWVETLDAGVLSYLLHGVSPRLSRAQASVYLKHLDVWKRIAAGSAPRSLVLEDDSIFPSGFARTFDEYLSALPPGARAVFFGASCGLEAPPMPDNPRFASVDRTRSMSGYVVTRDWCRDVLADLDGAPLALPVDLAVDAVIRRRSLSTCWSVPALIDNGSESGVFPRALTKGPWRTRARAAARVFKKQGARFAALALAGVLLAPVLVVRVTRLARDLVSAGGELWADDYEQRRIDGYGYCDRRGYGYVRRVLRKFPETDALPRIHYGDTERYAGLLLPEDRPRLDPRIFIGINLDWRDTRERMWPATADPARAGAWTIRTVDIDLLTGLQVTVADTADVARTLELTLFETRNRIRVLGRWTLVVPAGARSGIVRLEAPLEGFSIRRGRVDFVLDIASAASVSFVSLTVVPIDGRGLVVVQEEGTCLTAVTADLLREIEGGTGPWASWLADLRRAP